MANKLIEYFEEEDIYTEEENGEIKEIKEDIKFVMIDLNHLKTTKLLQPDIHGTAGSFSAEEWYQELYKSFDNKKKSLKILRTGIGGESDYYTMHLDVESKEDGQKLIKYCEEYFAQLTDKNILEVFSKLPEIEKFYGAGDKFFKKLFASIHENIKAERQKKKSVLKNKM